MSARFLSTLLSPPDLISQLMDPLADSWLDQETYYNYIPVPESYTGPHLSFPLSVSDTNTLLAAFKEQKVPDESAMCSNSHLISHIYTDECFFFIFTSQTLHARYILQLLYETKQLLKRMPNIIHLSTSCIKEITICGSWHELIFTFEFA